MFLAGGYDYWDGGPLPQVYTISLDPKFPSCTLTNLPFPRTKGMAATTFGVPVMCGGHGVSDQCYRLVLSSLALDSAISELNRIDWFSLTLRKIAIFLVEPRQAAR